MIEKIDPALITPHFNIYGEFYSPLDINDRMVTSFGPCVNHDPSPSDPLVNRDRFIDLRTKFSIRGNQSLKFVESGKLYAGWSAYKNTDALFGLSRRSDMCDNIRKVLGRTVSVNTDKPSRLLLKVGTEKSYPVSLRQEYFDSKNHMLKSGESRGEIVMLSRYGSIDTAYKHIAYILSLFNGRAVRNKDNSINFEKVLELFPIFFVDQSQSVGFEDKNRQQMVAV